MGRRQVQGSPEQSSVWSRYESTPAVSMATLRSDRASFQDLAPIKGNSKPSVDVLTEPGRHELIMGHEGESGRQTLGYRPTPGLISLFTKTGVRRPNPKCPNFSPQCSRRSYADVIRSNMEQGGAPMNNSCPGFGPCGYQPGPPRGAGQVEAFHGGFNRPYPGYGGGSYARRGRVNRF
jgi:hypothetical protein